MLPLHQRAICGAGKNRTFVPMIYSHCRLPWPLPHCGKLWSRSTFTKANDQFSKLSWTPVQLTFHAEGIGVEPWLLYPRQISSLDAHRRALPSKAVKRGNDPRSTDFQSGAYTIFATSPWALQSRANSSLFLESVWAVCYTNKKPRNFLQGCIEMIYFIL